MTFFLSFFFFFFPFSLFDEGTGYLNLLVYRCLRPKDPDAETAELEEVAGIGDGFRWRIKTGSVETPFTCWPWALQLMISSLIQMFWI